MGTLMRKIQRQLAWVTSRPPRMGPSAGASSVGIMMYVLALARSAGGKARNSMVTPTGVSMPPPTPCSTLKAMSCSIDCASAHASDPATNAPKANMNTRLVPNRSPSQPDTGIHTARLSV